jgi:hypothetical protein
MSAVKPSDWSSVSASSPPFRLGLSVMASIATQHVQTIADLHCQFNELWELDTDYNAFDKQLLKPAPLSSSWRLSLT